jgi:hypothetical protein
VQLILADDYPNFSICGIPSVAKTALLVGPAPAGPAAPPDPRAFALQVGVGDRLGW